MKTIELKNALPLSVFSHEMVSSILEKSFSNVNEKISNLVKNGDLIRLKKGFYIIHIFRLFSIFFSVCRY